MLPTLSRELPLTSSEILWANTPEKALGTQKNAINRGAVTTGASGRFVVDMKM
jgi:hypothetical protein